MLAFDSLSLLIRNFLCNIIGKTYFDKIIKFFFQISLSTWLYATSFHKIFLRIFFQTNENKNIPRFDKSPMHYYLMGLGPNPKIIPQNSGKQIRMPEGMKFNSLVSKKSEKAGHRRKITKPIFPRWMYVLHKLTFFSIFTQIFNDFFKNK